MTPHPQPERDLIVALFRRIGEQSEFKEAFEKLPNAERSIMAGDFYNIITSHSNTINQGKVHTEFCYPDCALFERKDCPHPGHGVNITHCELFQEKWYYSDTKEITLSRFKTQAKDILQRVERIKTRESIDDGLFDLSGIQFDAERILGIAKNAALRTPTPEAKQ